MRALNLSFAAAMLALAACNGGVNPPINNNDMTMGDPNAPVEVIEYAAASCGHCANFAEHEFPTLKAQYIDTGKARYALREVVLNPSDSYGIAGFMLARCAGRERYFPVLDAVFRGQTAVQATGDARGVLLQIAQSAGMSSEEFDTCVGDQRALDDLMRRNEGSLKALAGGGTPKFYVDGKPLSQTIPEDQIGDEIGKAIDAALNR